MIIECKNCNTKFRVNTSDIGENGRMISCSVCRYEWLYIPTSKKSSPTKELVFPDEIKQQESATTQKESIFLATIVNLLIVSIFLAVFLYMERDFLIKQHYTIEAFYKVFDYHNIDGLELKIMKSERLKYSSSDDGKKIQYKIPIKIINHTDKTKFLQVIKIIGHDANCNQVINLFVNIRKNIVPHSELKINLRTEEMVEEVDFIIAKMGNIHDLRNFGSDSKFC